MMKTRIYPFFNFSLSFILLLTVGLNPFGLFTMAEEPLSKGTEFLSELQEADLLEESRPQILPSIVSQAKQPLVTYGAEKEGWSANIMKLGGPSALSFQKFVHQLLFTRSGKKQKQFLQLFLDGLITGVFRQTEVTDIEGKLKDISYEEWEHLDVKKLHKKELLKIFDQWIAKTDGRPFSFVHPEVAKRIYEGTFPGLSPRVARLYFRGRYHHFVPHFGLPQKYIEKFIAAVDAWHSKFRSTGWEINFKVQQSYGEFIQMINWFIREFSDHENKFGGPGHHRLVHPKELIPEEEREEFQEKLAEFYRAIQALIVLNGIGKNTRIEFSEWLPVHSDKTLRDLKTEKGVIRLEDERWGKGTRSIEIRAGTRNPLTFRVLEQALLARTLAYEWKDLKNISQWELLPSLKFSSKELMQRFGVSVSVANAFLQFTSQLKSEAWSSFPQSYLVPFWYWENAPFLSDSKKSYIKKFTKDLIEFVAKKKDLLGLEDFKKALQNWVKVTDISTEYLRYIVPKDGFPIDEDTIKFQSPSSPGDIKDKKGFVDVNNIPMGFEYTGRFPIRMITKSTKSDDSLQWLDTLWGLELDEVNNEIEGLSHELHRQLNLVSKSPSDGKISLKSDQHGHGLGLNYQVSHGEFGDFKVEWDGISRNYSKDGKIIPQSLRGGHLEVSTPKGIPKPQIISAIFNTFERRGILPSHYLGGGHISVDLEAFRGRPRALARLIILFHQHRNILSLMFQSPARMLSAEPVDVSHDFLESLKNFNGTELELRQILYNGGYFNPRVGRKTRYIQMDLSSYFQDVIPEEYLFEDFDIKNPIIPWRPQFRLTPDSRRIEFRMMNAPLSPQENALQIKMIRALLHKALNEENLPTAPYQDVDYETYLRAPSKAFADFEVMVKDLHLEKDYDRFRPLVSQGLYEAQQVHYSPFFRPLEAKLKDFAKWQGWKKAETTPHDLKRLKEIKASAHQGPEEERLADDLKENQEKRLELHLKMVSERQDWVDSLRSGTSLESPCFRRPELGQLQTELPKILKKVLPQERIAHD